MVIGNPNLDNEPCCTQHVRRCFSLDLGESCYYTVVTDEDVLSGVAGEGNPCPSADGHGALLDSRLKLSGEDLGNEGQSQ